MLLLHARFTEQSLNIVQAMVEGNTGWRTVPLNLAYSQND